MKVLKKAYVLSLALCLACSHTPSKDASAAGSGGEAPASEGASSDAQDKPEFIRHSDEHSGAGAYLAMNLPYGPYEKMLHQVEAAENIELKNRSEAHITVVTPIEYEKVLKKHLSMEEINKIAEDANIEGTRFTPICIGRGSKTLNRKKESTYFLVVDSPGLIDLRGMIEDAYIKKGGEPQEFVPEKFHPHVTLGYTLRDLHYEDGILKTKSSCFLQLKDLK